MEHPLIGNLDELTLEQISERVNDLYKKLGIAQRTGNSHLCNQLRMALETFNSAYQRKLKATQKQTGVDFGNIINIE